MLSIKCIEVLTMQCNQPSLGQCPISIPLKKFSGDIEMEHRVKCVNLLFRFDKKISICLCFDEYSKIARQSFIKQRLILDPIKHLRWSSFSKIVNSL